MSMIKLLPGQGATGLTNPSGYGTAAGCCSGHLRTSAWWEVGQYSLPQERDCKASCGFVGSRREVPGNCFLVEMAGYRAKPGVSCSV